MQWRLKYYSGGWNIERVRNSNGSPLFGFPIAFGFSMVFFFEQNGSHFVYNHCKSEHNGGHFVQNHSKLEQWLPFCSDFQWFGFRMVGTIALGIAITDY